MTTTELLARVEAATCATCRFSFKAECRRNPPMMQGNIAPHGNAEYQVPQWAIWPAVGPDDWCGEHQPALLRAISEKIEEGRKS